MSTRFRDRLRKLVPVWLSDRPGLNVGFRVLWEIAAVCDVGADVLEQGLLARFPGYGTPTALPYIGRSRGILRGFGLSESDDHYVARLRAWLDTLRGMGSQEGLALQLHEYISNHPKVSVVNRAGKWTIVDSSGNVTTAQATFDWDSVSNPERSGWWSELFVIIYRDPWGAAPALGSGSSLGSGLGIGHLVTREEYDAVRGIIADWKAAHSRVRAVIWTTDATLFDPTNPSSLPDGQWGQWGTSGYAPRQKSHRNTTTCKIWEPN